MTSFAFIVGNIRLFRPVRVQIPTEMGLPLYSVYSPPFSRIFIVPMLVVIEHIHGFKRSKKVVTED